MIYFILFIVGFIFGWVLKKSKLVENLGPPKTYIGINDRCWVCGNLIGHCKGPKTHSKKQKTLQLNHLKSLGYNHNLPNID